MTAIISADINMGNKIPVDAFSPKTKAKISIITIPIPFIPDLEMPNIKPAKPIASHCPVER